MRPVKFDTEETGNIAIVRLSGEFSPRKDCDRVLKFYERLGENPRHVIINLEKVKTVSSWVLAIVSSLHKMLAEYKRRIYVVKKTDDVRLILIVAGLDKDVEVFPDEESAIVRVEGFF
ncbi:MAG: STAS domain-containing protein [Planctomycetota bacterium]